MKDGNMDIINSYFKGLTFYRVEEVETFAVYTVRLSSLLAGGKQRFIILFVPRHLGVQLKAPITQLPWRNLQTRELPQDKYKIPPQTWKPDRNLPDLLLEISERTLRQTTYSVQMCMGDSCQIFPFEVVLLHNPKKRSKFQYSKTATLSSALQTFNCVINYTGEEEPTNGLDFGETEMSPIGGKNIDYELL